MSDQSNDDMGLGGPILGIAIIGVVFKIIGEFLDLYPHYFMAFLLVFPFLMVLFYAAGKLRDYRVGLGVACLFFPVVFYLWGIPHFHTPLWEPVTQFSHTTEGQPYFSKIERVREEIAKRKRSIADTNEAIVYKKDQYRKYKSRFDKKSIESLSEDLRRAKGELGDLKRTLKKVSLREKDPDSFMIFAQKRLKERFESFNNEMTRLVAWMIGLSFLFYWIGLVNYKGSPSFLTKLGFLFVRPIERFVCWIFGPKEPRRGGVVFSQRSEAGYLTDRNLALHTQVVGGSGSGKSNFLKTLIQNRVASGYGVIFLDFKADFEVQSWLKGLCGYCDRKDLRMMSLSSPELSAPYNPIESGTPTEITSQIMSSFSWSEEFYKNYTEDAILTCLFLLCHLRDKEGLCFHLGHLLKVLLDGEYRYYLLSLAKEMSLKEDVARLFLELDDKKNQEKVSGFIVQLRKLVMSEAGPLFTSRVEEEEAFSLSNSLTSGEVVYLCMNSLRLREVASVSGKMILQDLMKGVGKLYDRGEKTKVSLIIDEFASFATPDFISFLDKARGAGVEIVIAHQSMSDLRDISDNFGVRVFENTASKVIFNTLSSDDAEMFSSMLGTEESTEETMQISSGIFFKDETGLGTRKNVEKFSIHPNIFKRLGVGEAVVAASKVDQHFGAVEIDRAFEFDSNSWDENFGHLYDQKESSLERSYLSINLDGHIGGALGDEESLSDGINSI